MNPLREPLGSYQRKFPHQTFTDCMFDIKYIFWYVNISQVTAVYGRFSDVIWYFWEFSYIITFLKRCSFIKLLQIVCYLRSAGMKSKSL